MIRDSQITERINRKKRIAVEDFLRERKMEIEKKEQRLKKAIESASKEIEELKEEYEELREKDIDDLFYNGSGDIINSKSSIFLQGYTREK